MITFLINGVEVYPTTFFSRFGYPPREVMDRLLSGEVFTRNDNEFSVIFDD